MIRKCPKCQSLEICQQEEHPGGYIVTFNCGLAVHLDRNKKLYKPPREDPETSGKKGGGRQAETEWYGLAVFRMTLYGMNPEKLRRNSGGYFWQTEPPLEVILAVYHQPLTRKTEKRRVVAMEFLGARTMMEGDVGQIRSKGMEEFLNRYPTSQRTTHFLEHEPGEYLPSLFREE